MHGIIWYNSEKNILQLLSEIPKNRPKLLLHTPLWSHIPNKTTFDVVRIKVGTFTKIPSPI